MAGPANATIGGQNFPVGPNGVRIEDFGTAGGAFRAAYDNVAAKLQTTDRERITNELRRQFWAQNATPADTAAGIAQASTHGNARGALDPAFMAAQVDALRRTNPDKAARVEAELFRLYPDAGLQSRIAADIRTLSNDRAAADVRLQSLGSDAPPIAANAPAITRNGLDARVAEILRDATHPTGGGRGQPRGDTLNVQEVAYQIEKLAAANPRVAQLLRMELSARMSPADAATFNRVLAGNTNFGEGIGRALAHPGDGTVGAVKGVANGGLSVLDLLGRGAMLQSAGEQQQAAAMSALFGNDKAAAQLNDNAAAMRDAASRPVIAQIPYANIAQSGGGDVGTIADLALAGKGLASVGARALVRNADEVAGAAERQIDEIGAPLTRVPDEFDKIAAAAKIDMRHILEGHLNKKGQAVGFHARPDGIDPPNSKMVELIHKPNTQGVYVGKVEVRESVTTRWVPKKSNDGESTFFPDHMNAHEIELAVRHAYADALRRNDIDADGFFSGDSALGFQISGYARDKGITSAFPIF